MTRTAFASALALALGSHARAQEGFPATQQGPGGPRVKELGSTGQDADAALSGEAQDFTRMGTEEARPGELPEYHTVKTGDTLWDLSKTFLNDPWAWPTVWSYNPQITNPHWIYPGDRVRLWPPGAAAPPAPPPSESQLQVGGSTWLQTNARVHPATIFERQDYFVDEAELAQSAEVAASRAERMLLVNGDTLFMDPPSGTTMRVGQRYTVFRVERPLVHPNDPDRKLGWLVHMLGTVEVSDSPPGRAATGTVVDSDFSYPIERGDRVGPLKLRTVEIVPKESEAQAAGVIVALQDRRQVAPQRISAVVDVGSADGVQVGNRLLVVSRGDPAMRSRMATVKRDVDAMLREAARGNEFPPETIGEILAIDVRDHVTLGVTTNLRRELQVGDHVVLKRGY